MVVEVISPHTEEAIAEVTEAGPADIEAAIDAARVPFDSGPWGRLSRRSVSPRSAGSPPSTIGVAPRRQKPSPPRSAPDYLRAARSGRIAGDDDAGVLRPHRPASVERDESGFLRGGRSGRRVSTATWTPSRSQPRPEPDGDCTPMGLRQLDRRYVHLNSRPVQVDIIKFAGEHDGVGRRNKQLSERQRRHQ